MPRKLSAEAKAEIAAAVAIIKSDRTGTPPADPTPPKDGAPPPPKPPKAKDEPKPEVKRGLFWGDRLHQGSPE